MNTPKDIIEIANVRFNEAVLLFNNEFYEGAFYLAGYSIELAFKARICILLDIPNLFDEKNKPIDFKNEDLRPFRTHNLKTLLLFSECERKLREDMNKDESRELLKHWSLISNEWNENCRYLCTGSKYKQKTSDLINAIGDKQKGILTWILNN